MVPAARSAPGAETILRQEFPDGSRGAERIPLSLRLTGQLMLGVVYIYQKKLYFLHQDFKDVQTKAQQVLKIFRFRCKTLRDIHEIGMNWPGRELTLSLLFARSLLAARTMTSRRTGGPRQLPPSPGPYPTLKTISTTKRNWWTNSEAA